MAEREGFEPSIRGYPYTHFPGVRLQPLGHLSVGANCNVSCANAAHGNTTGIQAGPRGLWWGVSTGLSGNPRAAARTAGEILEGLVWRDQHGLKTLWPTLTPPLFGALCAPGLLVDALARLYGACPVVQVCAEPMAAAGKERHIKLLHNEEVLIEAYSLLPAATLAAHPWLDTLGDEALGLAFRRHGFTARSPYTFARAQFPLLVPATSAAPAIARRFSFLQPEPLVSVIEVFSPGLLARFAQDSGGVSG